jgi:hypothetical protein
MGANDSWGNSLNNIGNPLNVSGLNYGLVNNNPASNAASFGNISNASPLNYNTLAAYGIEQPFQEFNLNKFDNLGAANNSSWGDSWLSTLVGGKGADGSITNGVLNPLIGLASAGLQGWLGMQTLKQNKENLAFQKDAFSKQFENQRTLTNSDLRDRQNARVASNPGAYQSTDEYMKNNGV